MRRPNPIKAATAAVPAAAPFALPAALAAAALACLPALAQDGVLAGPRPAVSPVTPVGPPALPAAPVAVPAPGGTPVDPSPAASAADRIGVSNARLNPALGAPPPERATGSDRGITGGADLAFGLNRGASDRLETRVNADVESRTTTQTLGLSASGTLLGWGLSDDVEEDGWELADPTARFRYRRTAFDGFFDLRGSVSEDRLSFLTATDPGIDLADPFLDPSLLFEGEGLRRDVRLSFAISALEDLPVGVEISGAARDTDYIGTPEGFVDPETGDPLYLDTRTGRLDAALRLDVTPLLTTRIGLGVSRADTGEDFGSYETRSASVSADYRPTERLSLQASLGVAETFREEGDRTETGITASLGGAYELPRGSIGLSYARVFDISGARDEIALRRDIDLPGGDALGVEVGLSRDEGGTTETIGAVDYVRTGRRGDLALSFGRSVRSTVSGNSAAVTTLGAAYRRELTRRDGLTVTADYTSVGSAESGRVAVGLDRQITRDWGLSAGVERRIRNGREDDAVFLTLGRRFQLGG